MLQDIKETIKSEKISLFKGFASDIFSWKELENVLNLRPFINAKTFRTANNDPYSWEDQAWLTDINSFPPSLLDSVIRQHLCLLIDASRVNAKINEVCGELEEIFPSTATDAHIYFTLNDGVDEGFGIHWDASHNFILQVEGTTRFQAWDEWSLRNRNVQSLEKEPVIDEILSPGDAIFVPRYHYHNAVSQSKRLSISFAIGFDDDRPRQDRHWIKI